MNTLNRQLAFATIAAVVLCSGSYADDAKKVESWSRIVKHANGTQTHSRRDAGKPEIEETTYNENGVKQARRVFLLDSKDRTRNGIIYDAKDKPLASAYYSYDAYDKLLEEQLFDAKGRLIRRLFYPGALKDPRNAKTSLAFLYDPDSPNYNPKKLGTPSTDAASTTAVRPVQDGDTNFNPGVPIGSSSNRTTNTTAVPVTNSSSSRPAASNTRPTPQNGWEPGSAAPESSTASPTPTQGQAQPRRTSSILTQRRKTGGNR